MSEEDKLTNKFAIEAINYLYRNNNLTHSLLSGKNIREIESFSTGKYSMKPFKKMFKSMRRVIEGLEKTSPTPLDDDDFKNLDSIGIDWAPVPLIPTKLNSAVSTINRIPIEVQVIAQDPLAMKKQQEDIQFLKNKPTIEKELEEIAAMMGLPKIDLGETEHSAQKYSDSPMGLDLNEPDEENIFIKLLYALRVEKAFEKALSQFYVVNRAAQVKLLEVKDQFKFGVSAHFAKESYMTGLPDLEYVFPGNMEVPHSDLPDYSDNTHRVMPHSMTVSEMWNYFGDEIGDDKIMEEILNGPEGYTTISGHEKQSPARNNTSYRVTFKHFEVKSVDWIGVRKIKQRGKRPPIYQFTKEENTKEKKTHDFKIWGQNTYGFWWLNNTKYTFGHYKLGSSRREKGQEAYQTFSTDIYKSQKVSAVELCIGENKKAQIADIKLQHCLIQSMPPGKYADLRFLRSALGGLKEQNDAWTQEKLLYLLFEKNFMLGDTEGYDGKNDGQMKPVIDLHGGLPVAEIQGYLTIMLNAARNVSAYTGINDELIGQSSGNPEGLVGMQKLLLSQSQNSISYVAEAIKTQYENLNYTWASLLQEAIKKGGRIKQAMINYIGIDDVDMLDGLEDVPLHNLTLKVQIGQREIERQEFKMKLEQMNQRGMITSADEYMLTAVDNPREKLAALAVIEKKWMKKQDQIRKENYMQQQQLLKQQGDNALQEQDAETKGDIQKIYAGADAQSKVMQLAEQTGIRRDQMQGLIKKNLQKDRNDAQLQKLLAGIKTKTDAAAQTAL